MAITARDISTLLKTNAHIASINFGFPCTSQLVTAPGGGFGLPYAKFLKVYPQGYRDVASLIESREILVVAEDPGGGIAAKYWPGANMIAVRPDATLDTPQAEAIVVHEATHALLDLQGLGTLMTGDNEGAAYVAEALFLSVQGAGRAGDQDVRRLAEQIALDLLRRPDAYWVEGHAARTLADAVNGLPNYASSPQFLSDGLNTPALEMPSRWNQNVRHAFGDLARTWRAIGFLH